MCRIEVEYVTAGTNSGRMQMIIIFEFNMMEFYLNQMEEKKFNMKNISRMEATFITVSE